MAAGNCSRLRSYAPSRKNRTAVRPTLTLAQIPEKETGIALARIIMLVHRSIIESLNEPCRVLWIHVI